TIIVNQHGCVITCIYLDHKEYVGDTRELVGFDKAGIFRTNTPAIVGVLAIPNTVTEYGNDINADMELSGRDFIFTEGSEGVNWR
ncbi:bifunctional tetrahydrofolate synthase/dihydrofolate synthase, partial [Pseudoalteromonas sp. S2721]